ncbi:MAG: ABC transporter permease [Candidatus Azobacteroides sp.]|nr:ABC transporter permease [Candidatus Azobacteroides sp.]
MNKIRLITKREYFVRVRKKSFLLLSVLSPLLFSALILIPFGLAEEGKKGIKNILIMDETGKYENAFFNTGNYHFHYQSRLAEEKSYSLDSEQLSAILILSDDLLINPQGSYLYSYEEFSLQDKEFLEEQIKNFLREQMLLSINQPELLEKIQKIDREIDLTIVRIDEQSENMDSALSIFAITGALLIYFFIFMYGAQVMHSVMEEKNNRMVEILISSVKPFQLMTGKILGTLLVALTQFLIWILLTALLLFFLSFFLIEMSLVENFSFLSNIGTGHYFNGSEFLIWFFLYFLMGYLLYSSLFAAIGSVIESGAESQQFVLPVTLPLFFAVYISIYYLQYPESDLIFWTSFIPFTSPVVMIARLPFGVPTGELYLSFLLLAIAFLFTTKIAGKIYKTGILLYGKKITYKEIWKWIK